MNNDKLSRREALKQIVILPALAGVLAAGETLPASAADNKKQFHYQDKPKDGKKCSGCRFFRKPEWCSIVTGKISPDGWCIAWAKR
ncbi:MAG TPA: high-potential iron-sulfur protein [Candidatus Baltobacteraceae bacterium]|nr:high-potential iron-sulfur protein [Candidatus Baltobacteraceae bacterium]